MRASKIGVIHFTTNVKTERLSQIAYLGRGSFLYIKFYASFFEQVYKEVQVYECARRTIVILTKADISLYLGVDQHLGTLSAWRMCAINSAPLKADAMETGLYDYILLSVNPPAYFRILCR